MLGFTSFGDMVDGGGAGGSGSEFSTLSHDDYRADYEARHGHADANAERHGSGSSGSSSSGGSSRNAQNVTDAEQSFLGELLAGTSMVFGVTGEEFLTNIRDNDLEENTEDLQREAQAAANSTVEETRYGIFSAVKAAVELLFDSPAEQLEESAEGSVWIPNGDPDVVTSEIQRQLTDPNTSDRDRRELEALRERMQNDGTWDEDAADRGQSDYFESLGIPSADSLRFMAAGASDASHFSFTIDPSVFKAVRTWKNDSDHNNSNDRNTHHGSDHDDLIRGDSRDDIIFGNDGDDRLLGWDGDDLISGGRGDDLMDGGSGADVVNGGDGFDTMSYWSAKEGVTVSLIAPQNNRGDAAGDVLVSIEPGMTCCMGMRVAISSMVVRVLTLPPTTPHRLAYPFSLARLGPIAARRLETPISALNVSMGLTTPTPWSGITAETIYTVTTGMTGCLAARAMISLMAEKEMMRSLASKATIR